MTLNTFLYSNFHRNSRIQIFKHIYIDLNSKTELNYARKKLWSKIEGESAKKPCNGDIFCLYIYIYTRSRMGSYGKRLPSSLPPLVSRYMVSRWNLARRIWHVDAPRNDRLLPWPFQGITLFRAFSFFTRPHPPISPPPAEQKTTESIPRER